MSVLVFGPEAGVQADPLHRLSDARFYERLVAAILEGRPLRIDSGTQTWEVIILGPQQILFRDTWNGVEEHKHELVFYNSQVSFMIRGMLQPGLITHLCRSLYNQPTLWMMIPHGDFFTVNTGRYVKGIPQLVAFNQTISQSHPDSWYWGGHVLAERNRPEWPYEEFDGAEEDARAWMRGRRFALEDLQLEGYVPRHDNQGGNVYPRPPDQF